MVSLRGISIGATLISAFAIAGCDVEERIIDETDFAASSSVEKEDTATTNCPDLSDLNSRVVGEFAGEPSRIEAAIEKEDVWIQDVLMYQAINDENSAVDILTEVFLKRRGYSNLHNSDEMLMNCFGFQPNEDLFRQRAERGFSSSNMRSEWATKVFDDFGMCGETEKQYEVIDVLKQSIGRFARSDRRDAYRLYFRMGDPGGASGYAKEMFLSKWGMDSANELAEYWKFEPERSWYDELGDSLLEKGRLWRAVEAYGVNDNREGIRNVFERAEQEDDYMNAINAAEHLGDKRKIRRLEALQQTQIEERRQGSFLGDERVPHYVDPTHELWLERGEQQLEQGNYELAFEAFLEVGDSSGIDNVLLEYTMPSGD